MCPIGLWYAIRYSDKKGEKMTTLASVLRFQNELLLPTLDQKYRALLDLPEWMGLNGRGSRFQDMTTSDAKEFIDWIGPAAYKVVRFSPDILITVRSAAPIVISGGSCLITKADKNVDEQQRETLIETRPKPATDSRSNTPDSGREFTSGHSRG